MNLLFWGLTVSMIGKLLLAAGVIVAHSKIAHEQRIDRAVIKSFKREQIITLIGVVLIITGYCLEIYFYNFDTELLRCSGQECEQAGALILSQ